VIETAGEITLGASAGADVCPRAGVAAKHIARPMDAATRVEAKYRRATTPHHPLRDFTSTPSNESMSRPPSVPEAAERVQWAFLAETQPALEDRVFFWAGACRFLAEDCRRESGVCQ